MRSKTKVLVSLLGTGAVFSLSACVALPTSGQVQASEIEVGSNQPLLGLSAPGPVADGSPEEIVTGFIRACSAGFSDDFTVARSFLAPKAAVDWKPDTQVKIFDTNDGIDITVANDGAVEASAKAVGSVDENGKYSVTDSTALVQERFSLVKGADNQWRISSLEDGVILSQSAFSSIYASSPVYFLAPDHKDLVPDLRWYPRRRLSSYLVNALLAGPLEPLQTAATSVFLPGTTLRGGTVEVFDRVANVPLDTPQAFTDPHAIALAYWQIGATLRDVSGISAVSLSLGNVPLENTEPINDPSGTQNPVMVQDGNLIRLVSEKIEVLIPATALGNLTISHPAVSADGKTIVFTDTSGQRLYLWSRQTAVKLLEGRELLAPSVDRVGWIWSANRAKAGQVMALKPDGTRVDLDLPWQDSSELETVTVSPDGTRLAAVRRVNGKDQVTLALIVRDQNGSPLSLLGAQDVELGSERVVSLAWVQGYSLVALTGTDDKTTVRIIPLFGPVSSLPGVKNASGLAAGKTENQIYLVTAAGELYQRSGRNWQHALSGVHDPTYPG